MKPDGRTSVLALCAVAVACAGSKEAMSPGSAAGGGSSSIMAGGSAQGGSGGFGAAGAQSAGGLPSGAGAASTSPIALPVPPGSPNVPRPTGSVPNLRVLDWAGFKAAATYTFDDSQPSQIDHFEEISGTGIHVTYYVNPVNNYYAGYDATWKSAVSQGSELGNHTLHHCDANLAQCSNPLPTIEREMDDCSSYIQEKLGQPFVATFAYPYGDTGYKEAARARVFLARGIGSGMIGPQDASDAYNLPVFAAVGGESDAPFSGAIDSARTSGKWIIFLFHSLLPNSANWYAGVDVASVTKSIAHAKELTDVWLDSLVNVGAYWVGQRLVSDAINSARGAGGTWSWTLPAHFPQGHLLRVSVDGGRLLQSGRELPWNGHGYYEVSLDAGALEWSP